MVNRFDFWTEEELEEIQMQNMYYDEVIAKKDKKDSCQQQESSQIPYQLKSM